MLALKLGHNIGGIANRNSFSNLYSLLFDGVDDYVNLSDARGEIDVQIGTFSAWAKLETTSINAPIFKFYVNANNQITIIYFMRLMSLNLCIKQQELIHKYKVSSSIENDGSYHHFAMTWNVDGGEFKAYVDGVQFGSTQTTFGSWSGSPTTFHLGHNALSGSDFWKGNMDEIAIFDSVKDVSALYNNGIPNNLVGESGLVGYWRNEEGTGTTIADQSGQGNSGTLINGTNFSRVVP